MIELEVPGDKSITHRALILSALAEGESRILGALVSEDTRSTAAALRALGVSISELDPDESRVSGVGLHGLTPPAGPLDCGNSGTTARLLAGVLAGCPFASVLDGDVSLRSRPMERVTAPLGLMGARCESLEGPGRLPLRIHGGALAPIDHRSAVASAQVKSALLLAGMVGGAWVLAAEPRRSRDHTERMLGAAGVPLIEHWHEGAWRVELRDPPDRLVARTWHVPGDFSAAAFWLAWGVLRPAGPPLRIRNVGLNPTRTGLLAVLARMGARVEVAAAADLDGETRGDLLVWPSELEATEVGADEVPAVIDELPLVAVLGARARGVTRVRGAQELRVKESDRIRAVVDNLRAVGAEARELPDGFEVSGGTGPLAGRVETRHDHRIAMAFGVLGALPGAALEIDDPAVAAVSYPAFFTTLERLRRDGWGASAGSRRPVVTIDGPAGSGKSTTAREVARRLGFRHLDSGALYRALTWALLRSGWELSTWERRTAAELEGLGVAARPGPSGVEVLQGSEPIPDADLRSPLVTAHVSAVAGLPAVRSVLLRLQRDAAAGGGLVADGRDMGTVVFPQADVKVFFTADLEERARRRLRERGSEPGDAHAVQVEASLIRDRDFADAHRELSPLRAAPDAHRIDTSALDFAAQVEAVLALVRRLTP
ncbi:MAG: 3-phosphoshikimate 1-carboxyvinyltransferase [Gemmatimonadota bacterium]